jgi:hypothetical protein
MRALVALALACSKGQPDAMSDGEAVLDEVSR